MKKKSLRMTVLFLVASTLTIVGCDSTTGEMVDGEHTHFTGDSIALPVQDSTIADTIHQDK